VIVGHSLRLVPLDRRHLDATRRWANDAELMRLMDRAQPVSEPEHEAWFLALRERRDCMYFAVESIDGLQHLGNIWLWNIDTRHRRAEVRIVIDLISGNRGLGRESIDLLARFAFESLHLHKLFAYVLSINPRARKAFERAGFEVEGLLKEDRWTAEGFVDVWLLGRRA